MRRARARRRAASPARALRPFFWKERRSLAGAAMSAVFLSVAELAKPWPLALAIDHLLIGRQTPFTLSGDDLSLLAALAAASVATALVAALAQYASDLWLQRAGERIGHDLRMAAYEHLQRLPLAYHHRRQKGDLVTRVTGDVSAVAELFSQSLGAITQAGLLLVGMMCIVVALDPVLALVSFLTLPPLAGMSFAYRRRVRVQARLQRGQEGQIASLANESLSAMPVVKASGSERFESERIRQRSVRRMRAGVEVARLQARFDGIVGVLVAAGTALVIVVGVLRVAAGALTVGDLVVFATYSARVNAPLKVIAREWTKATRAMARGERIVQILAADELLEDRPGAYRGPRARGELELRGVSFGYGPERRVLHDVSLSVEAGSRIALVGPSGSGKSTLGAMIARFYDPGSGTVLIDGRDVRDCSLRWLRGQVGVLLQDTVLFTGTVEENIAYGSSATTPEVVAAAKAAAADDFIRDLPAGYSTQLGPQGVGLSGGQRQRIGIARTLLRDPVVLILDEPTAALDSASEAEVVRGLFSLMEGRTTILVTHSQQLMRAADRVVAVRAGRLVAPAQARRTGGLLRPARRKTMVPGGEAASAGSGPRPRPAGRRLATSAPAPPHDPALPRLGLLLDPSGVAPALERSLGREEAGIERLRVRRVLYKPGRRAIVHYAATIAGARHDVVATALAGVDVETRSRDPRYAETARTVNGRSPSATPLVYDSELDAMISWLPLDLSLPALAEPPARLARRLREAGVAIGEGNPAATPVGYKPGRRAVLRLDGHVLKAYRSGLSFRAALAGLLAIEHVPVASPAFEAALHDLRLTVQPAVDGTPRLPTAAVACDAGARLRILHESSLEGLRGVLPKRHLGETMRRAEVLKALAPELEPRLSALVDRLGSSLRARMALLPAHGDFHSGQLLDTGRELVLIGLDEMCFAPPAFDVASYAAHAARGRSEDLAAVYAVLEPLIDGYGTRPPMLDWYLASAILCRATRPFQEQLADWPERTDAMLSAAEAALA